MQKNRLHTGKRTKAEQQAISIDMRGAGRVDHQSVKRAEMVRLKRIYDAYADSDGKRILVDRLWPRGIKKEAARVDLWLKDIAPSNELRKWFGHDPGRWQEFRRRYRKELEEKADIVREISKTARKGTVTLLYSAKDTEHNNAVVLREMIAS